MRNFIGVKILLFVPNGKGIYGTAIYNTLINKGAAEVIIYDERPSKSVLIKILIRFFKKFYSIFFNYYIKKIVYQNKNVDFNYVLIIRGEAFTYKSVLILKKAFSKAHFILYLWDSLKYTNTRSIFPLFDKIYSFDKNDANQFDNIIFRPLFFIPEYELIRKSSPCDIDILFIGKLHSDRYRIIYEIEKICNENKLKTFFFFYFPSKLIFFLKKIFCPIYWKRTSIQIKFKMLSKNEVVDLTRRAKCSIDIQHPLQSGLTIRSIEMLGANRKLITTNSDIINYEFYSKNNIAVIDRKKPIIDINFINNPFENVNHNIYKRYSLEYFLEEILR